MIVSTSRAKNLLAP